MPPWEPQFRGPLLKPVHNSTCPCYHHAKWRCPTKFVRYEGDKTCDLQRTQTTEPKVRGSSPLGRTCNAINCKGLWRFSFAASVSNRGCFRGVSHFACPRTCPLPAAVFSEARQSLAGAAVPVVGLERRGGQPLFVHQVRICHVDWRPTAGGTWSSRADRHRGRKKKILACLPLEP